MSCIQGTKLLWTHLFNLLFQVLLLLHEHLLGLAQLLDGLPGREGLVLLLAEHPPEHFASLLRLRHTIKIWDPGEAEVAGPSRVTRVVAQLEANWSWDDESLF